MRILKNELRIILHLPDFTNYTFLPSLKPTLDKMVEDGLSEDDAISVMVDVWAKSQGINVIYRNEG